jgi:hypothetical protein
MPGCAPRRINKPRQARVVRIANVCRAVASVPVPRYRTGNRARQPVPAQEDAAPGQHGFLVHHRDRKVNVARMVPGPAALRRHGDALGPWQVGETLRHSRFIVQPHASRASALIAVI